MANNEGSVGFQIIGISFERLSFYDTLISSVDTSNPAKLPTEEICNKARDCLHEIFICVQANFSNLSSNVCILTHSELTTNIAELNAWYSSIYAKYIKPLRAIIVFDTYRLQ